jgi:hypothetical protein
MLSWRSACRWPPYTHLAWMDVSCDTFASIVMLRCVIEGRRTSHMRGLPASGWIYSIFERWCPGEDSNLHELLHWYLKPARLPVPPPGQGGRLARRRNLRTHAGLVNRSLATPVPDFPVERLGHFMPRARISPPTGGPSRPTHQLWCSPKALESSGPMRILLMNHPLVEVALTQARLAIQVVRDRGVPSKALAADHRDSARPQTKIRCAPRAATGRKATEA